MSIKKYFIILILFVILGLTGCKTTSLAEIPSEDIIESTQILQETAELNPAATPEESSGETNHCLECHTDKQSLMDSADPVVLVESESSGAG